MEAVGEKKADAAKRARKKLFLSHYQAEASTMVERFYAFSMGDGFECWLDFYAHDKSETGMRNGVSECDVVIAFMSKNYLLRPFCQKELTWAQEFGKRVQVVIDPQDKGRISEFRNTCPKEYAWVFQINFLNLDISDMRWLQATGRLVLEAALDAPFAPSLPEVLVDLKKDVAVVQSRSDRSEADTLSSGATAQKGRLVWLRTKVLQIESSLVKKDDAPQELGKGGQATIEIAEYREQKVAVKVYGLEKKDEAGEERAYTEALLLGIISKLPVGPRHIVKFFGVYCTTVSRFQEIGLVLEVASEGSLDVILSGKSVPLFWKDGEGAWFAAREEYVKERGLGWMCGISNALRFLHEDLQIVHCDVKPGNVLLFEDGSTAKLTDFGSSYLTPDESWQFSRSVATKNGVGFTNRYKAPERIVDEKILSPKADMWSLGLIAYEIVHGTIAWSGLREDELAAQGTRNVRALLAQSSPWTPGEQQQTILNAMRQCLVLDPSARSSSKDVPNILRPPGPNAVTPAASSTHSVNELHNVASLTLIEEEGTALEGVAEDQESTKEPAGLATWEELATAPLEQRLGAFYALLAVGKPMHEINDLSTKFQGKESMLNRKLQEKYSVDLASKRKEMAIAAKRCQVLAELMQRLHVSEVDWKDLGAALPGNEKGDPPLVACARRGEIQVAVRLVEAGAPLDATNQGGACALSIAAQFGHMGVVDRLIAARCQIDLQDKDFCSALMFAAQNGHVGVVDRLIAARCQIDLQDKDFCSALMFAAQNGHVGVVDRLIAARCNVNLRTQQGYTALSYARQFGHAQIVHALSRAGARESVSAPSGAPVPNYQGYSQLSSAATPGLANGGVQNVYGGVQHAYGGVPRGYGGVPFG